MIKKTAIILAATISLTAAAQTPWLHIYHNDKSVRETTVTTPWGSEYTEEHIYGLFNTYPYDDIDSISYNVTSSGAQRMYIHYRENGKAKQKLISLPNVSRIQIGAGVPTFRITTSDPTLKEIPGKVNYCDGTLEIEGQGLYEDFSGEIKIRGRGNSTWNMDKKAYRLKLPEKTKLCGYRKAKNYVLLANRLDLSFMRNEVACLATQYAGCDFPTHATPVNVYFNKEFKGSYMLIEKVGINNGSVNMPKEQEAKSCMFQLDVSYDEDFKVKTPVFNLPLMHKDPDMPEDATEAKEWFAKWCDDFYEMEAAVASGTNIGDYLDYTSLAKYLLVYNISANQEINHPKSIYMYKTEGGKWLFGPAWDFDWAFGHSPTYRAAAPDQPSAEELNRMFREAEAIALEQYGRDGWGFISYNGLDLLWTGWQFFQLVNGDYKMWPDQVNNYAPSYMNYLLGIGKNNSGSVNGDYQLGNGGEFFLSMIKDNPEFMAEYKRVWEEFSSHLDEFWADFEAYAEALEPSAANDATVWEFSAYNPVDSEFADLLDQTYAGSIRQLREWLKKRIEFIGNPAYNYGLYDPKSTYVRGTVPYSK